jgi:hypothetical protein
MQVVFDIAPNRRADVPRTTQVFNVEFSRRIRAMEHIDAEQRHDAAAGFKHDELRSLPLDLLGVVRAPELHNQGA